MSIALWRCCAGDWLGAGRRAAADAAVRQRRDPIHIIIQGPFADARLATAPKPRRPGTLTVRRPALSDRARRRAGSRAGPATSATSRRCASQFTQPPPPAARCSQHQKQLKLVTHCQRDAGRSSKCAARIFRLPDVQSAHAAQLPRAARQHRLSSTTSGRPYHLARRLFHRGFRATSPSATACSDAHAPDAHSGQPARARPTRRASRCSNI